MDTCEEVRRRIGGLAGLPAAEVTAGVREHLAGCPSCARGLAVARLTRGLVATAAEGPDPPAGFAEGVLAALPPDRRPSRSDSDLWRFGWRLVPAFAVTAALVLVLYQASDVSGPTGLLPAEALSAGERLVLGASPPDPDLVLAAVVEGGGP
ncbi:MAG: zf-HC2 domain-containing protein [candidate division NC10 bacterium]|nr:zf-HC2 domain-containing protein [candidate division NC10 bacterium]